MITAILPKGRDKDLVKKLVHELGIDRVNVNHARGIGRITPLRHRGIGETTEKAIVTVMVDVERADEIFDFIYFAAELDRPHGGLMYQQPVIGATDFQLPDLPEERK